MAGMQDLVWSDMCGTDSPNDERSVGAHDRARQRQWRAGAKRLASASRAQ